MKLGPAMADVLTAQERLTGSLSDNGHAQSQLEASVAGSQHRLDALDVELGKLDSDIQKTDGQVKSSKEQVAVIARALYLQPDSLLVQVAQAGGPQEAVTATSDLLSAADRADSLQRKLQADLSRLRSDREKRQRARDEAARVLYEQSGVLDELRALLQQQQGTEEKLAGVIQRARGALSATGAQATLLGGAVADQIRLDERTLVAEAEREAWSEAAIWARVNHAVPPPPPSSGSNTASGSAANIQPDARGSTFIWPEQGASTTQGYGPTDLWFEPSFGGFAHFHTGIDLVSSDTRIFAASGGVVTAVGHGSSGYGNYIVVAHAGGYSTLYGHLSETMVSLGSTVNQGQQLGVEGSTGMSTGPHLHFEVRLNGNPVDSSPLLPSRGHAG
ncbi:peptidoglycan DD-metalloendopeptidase family protein [Candidatus Nephthysia bennettiae]|uniref:Peptidoglycan DD-metalloendopeptidase family protein n=1 Tax=Candidatus Nephthysia bennettiae TaxID=3127016 RepID=A0A934N847_9BACT|nr:peptidoglycan DD-metalloendopeptidase family protein [Candidatus Dormibacteraeota bacterium]